MNRADVLALNVVPDGKAPWLSYEQYQELKRLFEAVDAPVSGETEPGSGYRKLHRFLCDVAGLAVPLNEFAIHFNAFALIRRGYRVEEITAEEYARLLSLLDGLEQPDRDDMSLHEFGGHRELYEVLTRQMGLAVEPGRGPVWYRAKALVDHYARTSSTRLATGEAAPVALVQAPVSMV